MRCTSCTLEKAAIGLGAPMAEVTTLLLLDGKENSCKGLSHYDDGTGGELDLRNRLVSGRRMRFETQIEVFKPHPTVFPADCCDN